MGQEDVRSDRTTAAGGILAALPFNMKTDNGIYRFRLWLLHRLAACVCFGLASFTSAQVLDTSGLTLIDDYSNYIEFSTSANHSEYKIYYTFKFWEGGYRSVDITWEIKRGSIWGTYGKNERRNSGGGVLNGVLWSNHVIDWDISNPNIVYLNFWAQDSYSSGSNLLDVPVSPPDTCGPIDWETLISNPTNQGKRYGVYRSPSMVQVDSFSVNAYSDFRYNYQADEECEAIAIYELTDNGEPDQLIDHELPDSPDEPPPPSEPTPPPPPAVRNLPFDETELKEVVDDEEKSDVEKEATVDYLLWRRTDDRQQEVVDGLEDVKDAVEGIDGGAGGGGGGGGTGTGDYDSGMYDELVHMNDREDAADQRIQDALDENPAIEDMQTQGDEAASALGGVFEPLQVDYPDVNDTGAAAPNFELTLVGAVIDLNPFREDRFGPFFAWFRAAFAWFVLVKLAMSIWDCVQNLIVALTQARQARGNPVVAGTGGQATALIAASLLSVAIVVFATGLLSWGFGDISFSYMLNVMSTSPLEGIPSGVLWMLNQVFPVVTIITALVARVAFRVYGVWLFGISSMIVLFIVP